jgi:uncharacterized protein (TIGR02246 family)
VGVEGPICQRLSTPDMKIADDIPTREHGLAVAARWLHDCSSREFPEPIDVADDASELSPAELKAGISQAVERFLEAWNRHDAHALAQSFVMDADFTNVLGSHVRGRDKIQDVHEKLFSGPLRQSRQTGIVRSIRMLSPGIAMVDIDWEMESPSSAPLQAARVRRGLMSWVVWRVPDGSWMILILHNAEIPGAGR